MDVYPFGVELLIDTIQNLYNSAYSLADLHADEALLVSHRVRVQMQNLNRVLSPSNELDHSDIELVHFYQKYVFARDINREMNHFGHQKPITSINNTPCHSVTERKTARICQEW